ncbi:MAG: hypothetical protein Q4G03_11145 [Planctomycetia bacterium]|nr:hypothetical protein [Planctomycetia bacterium]
MSSERKNEYTSLEEFTSQYIGVWGPRDDHWLGLEFTYRGVEYRFHTWAMYNEKNTILPDGREAMFGLYQRIGDSNDFILLEEFADMDDALESTCIKGVKFREVIMDPDTELTGQD